MSAKRTKVFISYSHRDRDWLDRLRVHLKPLERDFKIEVWDDSRINPGSKWQQEIRKAIETSKVAVLLVSADFLASDFITTNELPPLLIAAEEDGATILPVILSPSRFLRNKGLSQFQTVNAPSNPLINMPRGEQEAIFVNVSECIEAALISTHPLEPNDSVVQENRKSEPLKSSERDNKIAEVIVKQHSILNRLEVTVSNPNYKLDFKALEDRWDLVQVVIPNTIIIVTGSHIICELLDRPVAETIRDEIDRQGDVASGRRGIVIGDLSWFNDKDLQSHHVISVGGPSINSLTKEITSQGIVSKYSTGVFRSVIAGQFLRVGLWGDTAAQTRGSAEFYMQHTEGLTHLLDICWSR